MDADHTLLGVSPLEHQDCQDAAIAKLQEPADFGGKLVPVVRIGDYVLGEIIGEGCFGAVQRATHRDGQVVALKRINLTQLSTFDAEQALHNEVTTMAQLSHEEPQRHCTTAVPGVGTTRRPRRHGQSFKDTIP